MEAWDEKRLAIVFGKDWNKTRDERGDEEFERLCAIAREVHGATLQAWQTADKKSNQRKAWRHLYGAEEGSE